MAMCKYCGSGIEWDEQGDKWTALNQDGSRHYCDRSKGPRYQKQQPKSVSFREYVEANPAPAYDSGVVRLSAERWAELLSRLDRIEALLTRSYVESEWQWPDGFTGTPA